MGALVVMVAIPPVSVACAWLAAVVREHHGACHPRPRWPLHRPGRPGGAGSAGAADHALAA